MTTTEHSGTKRLLTIGSVCERLSDEFPDISISKIRYLEDQGLVRPRRTRGGYRLFSEDDLERLATILRLQRDQFLPLKVIRDELDSPRPELRRPRPSTLQAEEGEVDLEELCTRADVDSDFVRRLEEYDLVAPRVASGERFYRASDAEIAIACAKIARHGLDARHLRAFRTAAGRQSALLEQLVSTGLRSRDPERRRAAINELEGLAASRGTCPTAPAARSEGGQPTDDADELRDVHPRRSGLPEARNRLQGPHAADRGSGGVQGFVDLLADWSRPRDPAIILGAEARGFIFGGALAYSLGCGFVPARKPGKLPWKTIEAHYDLEYGEDTLQVHDDAFGPARG